MIRRYTVVHDAARGTKSLVISGSAGKVIATFEGDDRVVQARVHANLLNAVLNHVLGLQGIFNVRIVGDDRVEVRKQTGPDQEWVDYSSLAEAIATLTPEERGA